MRKKQLMIELAVSEELIKDLRTELKEIKDTTALNMAYKVLDRPIEWIDSSKMPPPERKIWSDEAKKLLNNKVFISLVGRQDRVKTNGELVKNIIENIARYSTDWEQVQFLRATINGIELIREMAEAQVIPDEEGTKEHIHDAI